MKLSALLALLPLAAALPQALGPVEARAAEVETRDNNEDSCEAAYNNCTSSCSFWDYRTEAGNLYKFMCSSMCGRAHEHCRANQTAKRAVEEAPVETRFIEDECHLALDKCCFTVGIKEGEYKNGFLAKCRSECWEALTQCEANKTEEAPVEEAPVEAHDREKECHLALDKCCFTVGIKEGGYKNGLLAECRSECWEALTQCKANKTEEAPAEEAPADKDDCETALNKCCGTWGPLNETKALLLQACPDECKTAHSECQANQTAKRSVEDTLIQTRDNHAGDVTDCYDDVADCKADGGSIEKCYAPLKDCLWNLYYKYFD
ncbi:hypothetical protein J3F84DRAFT_350445 [Trichoderma pleuroticola]